MITALIRYVPR